MQKLKFDKSSLIFSIFILLAVILSGCKSLPESYTVEPLDLLDTNSDFYVSIPVQADPDFIYHLIKNNLQTTSNVDDNASQYNRDYNRDYNRIIERIEHIYCGINRSRNSFTVQAAAKDSIPAKYVGNQLKKNKSVSQNLFTTTLNNQYSVYSFGEFNFSLPSNEIALFGENVYEMLNSFDIIKSDGNIPENQIWENQEMYNYLLQATDEIRFYGSNPQAFLSILVGTNMNLKLASIFGAFKPDPDYPEQYLVDLHFCFKNEKYLKAGRTLLSLAFGLSGGQTIILDNNELQVSGIQINKEQLYKLLVL